MGVSVGVSIIPQLHWHWQSCCVCKYVVCVRVVRTCVPCVHAPVCVHVYRVCNVPVTLALLCKTNARAWLCVCVGMCVCVRMYGSVRQPERVHVCVG